MFHLNTATVQSIRVWKSATDYNLYKVTSRGMSGYAWTVQRIRNESASDLFYLKLDANNGLKLAYPKTSSKKDADKKAKTSVDPDLILESIQASACESLPTELKPDQRGSILLAVAVEVIDRSVADSQGVKINGLADRQPLTVNDWHQAYLSVESRANLPLYVRDQFIAVMAEVGLKVEFDPIPLTNPTQLGEALTQASQASQNGNHQAVALSA